MPPGPPWGPRGDRAASLPLWAGDSCGSLSTGGDMFGAGVALTAFQPLGTCGSARGSEDRAASPSASGRFTGWFSGTMYGPRESEF